MNAEFGGGEGLEGTTVARILGVAGGFPWALTGNEGFGSVLRVLHMKVDTNVKFTAFNGFFYYYHYSVYCISPGRVRICVSSW